MFVFLRKKYSWLSELLPFLLKAYKKGQELKFESGALKGVGERDILLFSTIKNEAHRLPFFLEYYRKLGVNHFIFVDNASTDDSLFYLKKQKDVTVFYTEGSYKDSNFGMHWLNYLLFKYGRGHWCVTCDPDEFIVYPHVDTRDLRDLTEYLSSINEDAMFALMVDMYSKQPVEESYYEVGSDPLEACPYFDAYGYTKFYYKKYRNLFVQGGVRKRVFAKNNPASAPALNKVPLVKWRWNHVYVESMHMALPRRLNTGCYHTKTTGALLHYKFISQLSEKVKEELISKQHYNDSAEYKQYDAVIKKKNILYKEGVSARFNSWKDLARLGLINKGEW